MASSWLIGGLVRIGEMTSRWTATPSPAPATSAASAAAQNGQP